MRLIPLTLLAAVLATSTPLIAQDDALQFEGATVKFPWENIMATGTEFTAEAWVRANPNCLAGSLVIFSRLDPLCTESKYLRIDTDGSISVQYLGSISTPVSSAAGAFPMDEDWHHVAFVHRADNSYDVYLDGWSVLAGTGSGFPIGFCAGIDTEVGSGDGWQLTEVGISDVARYSGSFSPAENFGGDDNYILLLHTQEGSGGTLSHDDVDGFPRSQTGVIDGAAHWVPGMHLDADSDGLDDAAELAMNTRVFDRDSDDDGISDFDEDTDGSDPLDLDSDDDGLQDGTEISETMGVSGDPAICILGTDLTVFISDADPTTSSDPLDDDTDDDGLTDGYGEDVNFDGDHNRPSGETDSIDPDTDNDCIQDGTEQSLTAPMGMHTDLAVFVPDADPASSTNPLARDTDGGGLDDGKEDMNCNGAIDSWGDCDPNFGSDDLFKLDIRDNSWFVGGEAWFDGEYCVPNDVAWDGASSLVMLYSFDGYGGSYINSIDTNVHLAGKLRRLNGSTMVGAQPGHMAPAHDGRATLYLNIPNDPMLTGAYVFFQFIEVTQDNGLGVTRYRISNPADRQIL
ncbi:MAG: hypothetical protein MK213_09845 [Planctomycetes bacterium]|nr:hypothetical protein [Planctomycetota bacterium]